MTELIFLHSADADIQAAFEYYEEVQPGRGEVFMQHLDAAVGGLKTFPEIARVFSGSYRRLLVPGHPYGVFYSVVGRRVIVSAVMDLRQNPETIRRRLGIRED